MRDLLGGGVARSQPHQFGLDQAARGKDLARLLGAGAGDKGAAVGDVGGDAVVHQPHRRLTDLGAADVEDLGQPVFDQLRARLQPVLADGREDALVDLFDAQALLGLGGS